MVRFRPTDENNLVKRVIATGGQTVACKNADGKGVTVDGKPLTEPHIDKKLQAESVAGLGSPTSRTPTALRTAAGADFRADQRFRPATWVMGDNRLNSADSRYHITDELQGTVPVSNIRGKVRFIISAVPDRWCRRSQPAEVGAPTWQSVTGGRRGGRCRAANLRTLGSRAAHQRSRSPSPVSMRPVAERARVLWWWPRASSNPHRSPRSPISTTRRSSRNRRASACIARSPAATLAWHAVIVDAAEVDRIGIHVANIEGMRRAIAGLHSPPGYVLSDGFGVPGLTAPSLPVIGGDGTAACIAAASVIAKVTRDRIMVDLDRDLPGYDFALHKGYSTAHHMSCIDRLGPSREHRMSYRNVAARAGGRPPITADPDRDTLTG